MREEFGKKRFIEQLVSSRIKSSKYIQIDILEAVNNFSQEQTQSEDITLIVLKHYNHDDSV